MCGGYYRYDQGYLPEFADIERYEGQLVHPQFWPEDLDYAGKRVLVIGSGATAVTLVPALAEQAAHVTMLQRSPSYILSVPSVDPIANGLRRLLGAARAYALARWKNVAIATLVYQACQRRPKFMRSLLRRGVTRALPQGYDVDTHFNPALRPVGPAAVPRAGRRSVQGALARPRVDGHRPDRALHAGRRAARVGRELEADIIVTATGLNLLALGGIELSVDGGRCRCPSGWRTRA